MDAAKRKRLEAKGWKEVTVGEFLDLTKADEEFVEVKVRLAMALVKRRKGQRLTQQDVADLVGSSQSRVARMERADPSVSLDLLVHAFLALGGTRTDLARLLAAKG
jgi:predicted XRE-type DNA-binding protein